MFSVDPQEGTVPLGTLLVVLLWSLPLIGAGRSEHAVPIWEAGD